MRRAIRIITAAAIVLTATVGGLGTATAESPAASGVVERGSAAGFSSVRGTTDVDGEMRDLIAVFNFSSAADICAANPAQAASVQEVLAPSAYHQSVKDRDVPVLVFDVTALDGAPNDINEFLFLVSVQQSLETFAWGSADLGIQFTASPNTLVDTFSARGSVADGSSEWSLRARFTNQLRFEAGQQHGNETIRLN